MKETEFEKQRAETIRKNQEYLASLNIIAEEPVVPAKRIKLEKKVAKRAPAPVQSRSSSRISGSGIDQNLEDAPAVVQEPSRVLTFKEYFDEETVAKAIVTDGHFKGSDRSFKVGWRLISSRNTSFIKKH